MATVIAPFSKLAISAGATQKEEINVAIASRSYGALAGRADVR